MPFETTRWSLVVAAAGHDPSAARAALGALCETYWYPLYAYVRRRGAGVEDAQDLVQGFLTSMLERGDFATVRRERGRFRAFLVASLQHFLANDAVRKAARKRGGGVAPLPLEFGSAEARYQREPADNVTPETLLERRWALTVIDGVFLRLRAAWEARSRAGTFDTLKACILGQAPRGGYAALAASLDMTEAAVKVAVHRLRREFQVELRREIAETVSNPAEIDDEIRYLIRALSL